MSIDSIAIIVVTVVLIIGFLKTGFIQFDTLRNIRRFQRGEYDHNYTRELTPPGAIVYKRKE